MSKEIAFPDCEHCQYDKPCPIASLECFLYVKTWEFLSAFSLDDEVTEKMIHNKLSELGIKLLQKSGKLFEDIMD